MQLNKNSSQFSFSLPKGFLHPKIEEMFLPVIKRTPIGYKSVLDYLNSTIQGIELPGFNLSQSEQLLNREPITWYQSGFLHHSIDKECTVSFTMKDGSLNWLILFLNIEFIFNESKISFHPDFFINIKDNMNYNLFSIRLSQIQQMDLPSNSFSWTENSFDTKSFDIKFRFNQMEFKFNVD